jgi:hypothetical protein
MSGVKIPAFSRPSHTLTPGEGLFPADGLFSCRDRDLMGRDSRVPSARRRSGRETGAQSLRITDRRQAIRTATMLAKAGDIILIAGKGHEDYQIIGREKQHFDDKEEVREAFGGIQNSKFKIQN